MSTGGSTRAVVAAMLANLGITVAKFVAFLFTRSTSMLAESIHSFADTGNQVLLLIGGKKAKKAATPLHQFGYGRERFFWSFVVSIILFTLGALFAIYEGTEKIIESLHDPHELHDPMWAIGVLVVSIVLEAFSFRTAIVEASHVKRNASWPQFLKRSKIPELPVVLLEDLGALVGLTLALGAVVMAIVTKNSVFDGIGSVLIGSLLFVIAVFLAAEMKSLLIGEAAAPEVEEQIITAISDAGPVVDLIHLRTEHVGPEELLVAAKVEFGSEIRVGELAALIDEVEAGVRAAVPTARYLFIEPDVRRPAVEAALRELSGNPLPDGSGPTERP